jgi:hypothetical protein
MGRKLPTVSCYAKRGPAWVNDRSPWISGLSVTGRGVARRLNSASAVQRHLLAVLMAVVVGAVVMPALVAPSLLRSTPAIAAEQGVAFAAPAAGSPLVMPGVPGAQWSEEVALLIVGTALLGLAAAVRRAL